MERSQQTSRHHKASPMPLLTITSPETIKKCANLHLQPNDIFICSYPKSGTTWTQHIIISLLLLHRQLQLNHQHQQQNHQQQQQNQNNIEYNHVSDYAPFLEIDPHWEQDTNELIQSIQENHLKLGRRIFNTHLRYDMLPQQTNHIENVQGNKVKYIYLLRSPLDVCVSFYYHLSHQIEGCYEKSFDEFFHEWINGDLPFGSWMDHILSYVPHLITDYDDLDINNSRDVLLITYEEMVTNLNDAIHKIVKYLELDDLIKSNDIENIIPSFTFSSMKKQLKQFQPKSVTWKNDFKFLRKGQVGDSKTIVTDEQLEIFNTKVSEVNLLQLLTNLSNSNKKVLECIKQLISGTTS